MTEEFCTKGSGTTKGCQSNCDQPGSDASGGDVQSRIIGYYESFHHDRSCNGMDFKDIPVGGLTHLNFAFGYVTPGDFNVAPMDNAPSSLFSDLTDMKKRNTGLKAIVALGGWTFNDNGTATQPVFSDMVGSSGNRAKFITNLLSFLREYAFDGVDFDWEYPGAPDRGGHPDDGINFTKFLSELKDAIAKEPTQYEVSFTVPTSYWYLRWFDLKAVDYVNWVNVMSYDLHGIWDSDNPIGSHVLAHTNLTEIKLAFDLFWRNKVPAKKLNLGLGFYGRSFQLSDPSCYKPGCNFKGGANPGACTNNVGTLSYKEITQIIDQHKITPYYDKVNAVKYIVWNQDQWVSYDDEVTFKQKIDFANKLGLGGLLIWSLNQDTTDLKALQAVLAPKSLKAFAKQADDADYWKDATAADCYVTDCGGSCKTGFAPITHQPCGGAKPVIRTSKEKDSTLCCPLDAAPDPKKCVWRGSAPSCNGRCHDGEVTVEQNRWGDGKYCEDGNKAYCCEVTNDKKNDCYWTGTGGRCNSGDTALTFAGTFLKTIADVIDVFPPTLIGLALETALDDLDMELEKRYCCPPEDAKKWTNCHWYGEPGSCFDNHCNIGHQVQLATSAYGQGESCAPRLERDRVFCCDPTHGRSPFLPVPLDRLFPHPPTGDSVATDFDLKVDNTWGDGHADTADDEPNDASFGFVVITSPEELQVSLDKRDGSHWELFNCNDAESEEEQTIQMFCTDVSDYSNCHKISLGHGVPGTILEMPKGCGPSKYAVAKTMVLSEVQLPPHLAKRNYGHRPVVYDLTFDFDWRRVPRDLGDTQMRVDFSNEVGYWDSIVNKAASKKRKRSLKDVGGNHKRWLEEEWRDDIHLKGLSRKELHARWFGSDVISWLRGLLNTNIKPEFTHEIDTTFTAKLIDETWGPCKVGGAKVDVVADGWVRLKAAAGVSSSGNCPFTYGIDVGADLFATVSAPSAFGWTPRSFPIAALPAKAAKEGGACPTKQKRSIYEALLEPTTEYGAIGNRSRHALVKRAPVVGPLLTLPKSCFFCPQPEPSTTDCASITGWEPAQLTDPDAISKRDFSSNVHYNYFEKRAPKNIRFCTPPIQAKSPRFDSSGNIISSVPNIATYGYTNPLDCNDFGFGLVGVPVRGQNSDKFATEHILEFQWLTIFLDELRSRQGNIYTALKDGISKVGLCQHLEDYWDPPPVRWITINGIRRSPLQWVSYQFPGSDSDYNSEFVLLDSGVNAAKVGMWGKTAINSDETMTDYEQQQPDRAVKNIKDVLSAYNYHQIQAVNDILVRQANRVGAMFGRMENDYLANNYPGYEKIGLQTLWTSWIKGRTDRARARAETYVKDGVKRLHDGYGSDYNRQFTNPVLLAKIDSLTTAVNGQQGWANPF